MHKEIKAIAISLSCLMLVPFSPAIYGQRTAPRNFHAGAVYVLTNQVENAVAVFHRNAQGTLTPVGEFLTGGAGDPVPPGGGGPAPDPLASQGALILRSGNQLLFAVNAGSGEDRTLTLVNSVAGDTGADSAPIDMALNNRSHFLYVLGGASQSVASFRVERNGNLTSIDSDGGLPLGAQGIAAK